MAFSVPLIVAPYPHLFHIPSLIRIVQLGPTPPLRLGPIRAGAEQAQLMELAVPAGLLAEAAVTGRRILQI